jgi:hypothetical protein
MMEKDFGPLGMVLAEIMRTCGLEPSPQGIETLAVDAGINREDLLREMRAGEGHDGGLRANAGDNHSLAWVHSTTEPEMKIYARGFARCAKDAAGVTAEALRDARRSPEHASERNQFPNHYPRLLSRPLVRYFDREYVEAEKSPRCCVGQPTEVGERCSRPATMDVYGVSLCAVHGAEAAAGARQEAREKEAAKGSPD